MKQVSGQIYSMYDTFCKSELLVVTTFHEEKARLSHKQIVKRLYLQNQISWVNHTSKNYRRRQYAFTLNCSWMFCSPKGFFKFSHQFASNLKCQYQKKTCKDLRCRGPRQDVERSRTCIADSGDVRNEQTFSGWLELTRISASTMVSAGIPHESPGHVTVDWLKRWSRYPGTGDEGFESRSFLTPKLYQIFNLSAVDKMVPASAEVNIFAAAGVTVGKSNSRRCHL